MSAYHGIRLETSPLGKWGKLMSFVNITSFIVSTVLISLFASFGAGQGPAQNAPTSKAIYTVVDPDGWKTPDLSRDKRLSTSEIAIGDSVVQETTYEPTERLEREIGIYSIDDSGALIRRAKITEISSYSTLEKDGELFGFKLVLIQFGHSPTAGRMLFGPKITIYLLDMDRDGSFESRTYLPMEVDMPLPNWVRPPKPPTSKP